MTDILRFFASCPKGTEDLLATELQQIGAKVTRTTATGLYFCGPRRLGYKVCLWSRVANRVLLELSGGDKPFIDSAEALYDQAFSVPWEQHFEATHTFAVDFIGTNKIINNSAFGAVKVKDAIVDRFRQKDGVRPNVSKESPNIRVSVHLFRDKVSISLDLSGESLTKRSYRVDKGIAPLKENLAAAMLMRAGWLERAKQGARLIDPMCGSGTFLVEAALMQAGIAPGLLRTEWGFNSWLQHSETEWHELIENAERKKEDGLALLQEPLYGFDQDRRAITAAKRNIREAGLPYKIVVYEQNLEELALPEPDIAAGLMICNPPYGERLGDQEQLKSLYFSLAQKAKALFSGWTLAVLSGNHDLLREMRLRAKKRNVFFNGPIESELWIAPIVGKDQAKLRNDDNVSDLQLDEGASMVFNRVQKNAKRLQSWISKNNIHCYRVYDADMPEYSAAIDVYEGQLHVQEYAPPKRIDMEAADKRLRGLVLAAAKAFNQPTKSIPVKTRKQNKGKSQYERISHSERYDIVREGKAKFKINRWDFLDTGLFLDHRPLRLRIAEQTTGKRFLNLFCYTGTATVHAALGGAISSTSVDLSNTYLEWALENFKVNHINADRHSLVRADCVQWLKQCREGFDVIMLDPPSFSNSKRMDDVLDVQRDHVGLINRCMDLLNPDGTLYFSTNFRKFQLDMDALKKWHISDITAETIDPDFSRNSKIHQCFEITHA